MILYHGSNHIIDKPLYGAGKKYNDYGIGFYCTENIELAKEWSVSDNLDGYVNIYDMDTDGLSILDINGQNYTIIHWINILINNRIFDSSTPLEREAKRYITQEFHVDTDNADIIKGYRADDSYFSYAKDFISGIISYEQLCKSLMLGNLGEQICLKSKKAFESIRFTGYQKVDYNEWYPKKMARDMYARNGYKAMEKENYRKGELYITKIIDEELKADDLCI